MSPRILVTGAAGRLGSTVSALLHEEGYEFLATDIIHPGEVPYPFRQADLLNHRAALELLSGIDAVMHIGNHPGIGSTPPQVVFNQNTAMNVNVFQGAAESGIGRIIFASTLQLIGSHPDTRTVVNPVPPPSFPLTGESAAYPTNLYSLSKVVAEQVLRYYADRCGIDCVALRLPLLHNNEERTQVRSGSETAIDIMEGFTGLTYRDAAQLFVAVLRSDLRGYRTYLAGTATRHRDLDVSGMVEAWYPQAPAGISDLIDNLAVSQETGWQISDDYYRPTSEDNAT